ARRAVPRLRHADSAGRLRRAHDLLLPDVPDRRSRPQGPADVAAAAVIASDGVAELRAPTPADSERIVAERDKESLRWFGPGGGNPAPVACVWVGGELVGWVDYDRDDDH